MSYDLSRPRVLLDIDGTSSDFNLGVASRLAAMGIFTDPSKVTTDYFHMSFPGTQEAVKAATSEPGFFTGLRMYEGLQAGITVLKDLDIEVQFCSRPIAWNSRCEDEKRAWIKANFGDAMAESAYIGLDKPSVPGTVLLDDKIVKPGDLNRASWDQVVYDQPWNQDGADETRPLRRMIGGWKLGLMDLVDHVYEVHEFNLLEAEHGPERARSIWNARPQQVRGHPTLFGPDIPGYLYAAYPAMLECVWRAQEEYETPSTRANAIRTLGYLSSLAAQFGLTREEFRAIRLAAGCAVPMPGIEDDFVGPDGDLRLWMYSGEGSDLIMDDYGWGIDGAQAHRGGLLIQVPERLGAVMGGLIPGERTGMDLSRMTLTSLDLDSTALAA